MTLPSQDYSGTPIHADRPPMIADGLPEMETAIGLHQWTFRPRPKNEHRILAGLHRRLIGGSSAASASIG